MARMTVLAVAVLCDGRPFPAGTSIDEIPPSNRESVRLRYCEEIEVPDRPTKPTKSDKKPAPPAGESSAPPPPPPTPPESAPPSPAAEGSADADDAAPESSTPLPAMAEELLVLLKAGGIETIEAAMEYYAKNKSFRPLKGVGEAKDTEIRAALGLQ